MSAPVVVVGSGIAGLSVAWAVSPEPVTIITAGELTQNAASTWAQGGIAAAIGTDDSTDLHAQDTFRAGAQAGDLDTINRITGLAPEVMGDLIGIGIDFDRLPDGSLDMALEGGHCRNRVAHVGDHSGAAITAGLAERVRSLPGVRIEEGTSVVRLLVADEGAAGITGVELGDGRIIETDRVVLATGGLGGLFTSTTNPLSALGRGVAMAARAGARVDDLHLVQFHPTALDVGKDPMPLMTEALRGAGAKLLCEGERFIGELEPRDVVSAAVWEKLIAGHDVFLDAREVAGVTDHFPLVAKLVGESGLSLADDLLPVRPAVHYSMGGVTVDARSRTSTRGLWAVGEVSRTGLHGANRLASNSLLEGVVTGQAAGNDAVSFAASGDRYWDAHVPTADPTLICPLPRAGATSTETLTRVRTILQHSCGVLRDGPTLFDAVEELSEMTDDDAGYVGWMIARSAYLNPRSVGAHRRTDKEDDGFADPVAVGAAGGSQ